MQSFENRIKFEKLILCNFSSFVKGWEKTAEGGKIEVIGEKFNRFTVKKKLPLAPKMAQKAGAQKK